MGKNIRSHNLSLISDSFVIPACPESFRIQKDARQQRRVAAPRRVPLAGMTAIFYFCSAALLLCILLTSGCKKKPPPPPPPPKVTVSQPVRSEVTDYLELTGNTQAINTVQLVARVAGYLDKVYFHDGQMVKKGQLLFLIQQNTYTAGLQQAEGQVSSLQAQLQYAERQFERYKNLLPEKASAQSDVDNWKYQRDSAKANLKAAEASRDLAKLNLGYTEITAPFDGRIDRRQQDPGNLVGSGPNNAVLAQLIQIDPIYVYFTISDTDLARLLRSAHGIQGVAAAKWPVSVGLLMEDGNPHQGHIDFAATSLTTTTGTLLMRGILSNPSGKVLPGLYARVRVPLERRMAMLVPATAVGSDQQGSYVLVVNPQDIVERRGVKTGSLDGTLRVIEGGLAGNEMVVVSALLKARPGSKVTPERENAPIKGNR